MGVFSRLSDIVNSNINSMLDKAEDPEKVVRLIIQEMEDTLVEVRSNAARALADRKEVTRKKDEFARRGKEWESKAELAIAKGREELARGAVAAKRKAEEMIGLLERELKAIDETVNKTNEDLERLQAKLKEARAKQRSLEIRRNAASDSVRVSRQVNDGRIEEALARFDRYERRIDELEAEAESWALGRPRTLEDEFAELESEDAVNAELEKTSCKPHIHRRAGLKGERGRTHGRIRRSYCYRCDHFRSLSCSVSALPDRAAKNKINFCRRRTSRGRPLEDSAASGTTRRCAGDDPGQGSAGLAPRLSGAAPCLSVITITITTGVNATAMPIAQASRGLGRIFIGCGVIRNEALSQACAPAFQVTSAGI